MKRFVSGIAVLLWIASTVWHPLPVWAAPATLTSVKDIQALSIAEANQFIPVAFQATITYVRDYEKTMFVQDGNLGMFVSVSTGQKLVPGDRVLIEGKTRGSFRPIVVGNKVTLLNHGVVPKPVPAEFAELIRGQHDCMLVTLRGRVRAADLVKSNMNADRDEATLQLLTGDGYVEVTFDSDDSRLLSSLLDADVEVTGVAGGKFDGKMQLTGVLLHVAGTNGIRILRHAVASVWDAPLTPMNEILTGYRVRESTQRIRVRGTITYYQPGSAVVLQNGKRSLWIRTLTHSPLHIGDQADATGFPDVVDGFLTLTRAEIRDNGVQAPISPQPVSWKQLAVYGTVLNGHHYDLVSIEGQVVMAGRGGGQDEYILVADGHPFSAIFRHNEGPLPDMKRIPLGSMVRVAGICTIDDSNPFNRTTPFQILLRSFDDIAIVARPSPLSTRNLMLLVGVLLVVLIAGGIRGWTLERKVRVQTGALAARIEAEAALERRRSQILEDINGTRPLAEILEEITEMVSSMLNGQPSWCEIDGGARLGNYPENAAALRIEQEEIPARIGPALGRLYAGAPPEKPASSHQAEALFVGARLATLAIETRKLYSDLRHRSEFDLLTDIHNRFSLERFVDTQIEQAREQAGVFGLIYIDLDRFKQINDLYGHQAGDHCLQKSASRMKHQLRPQDMLARLGGDEFAAVVPMVRNRAEVEEIAQRLERCLDEPLLLDGVDLRAAASVGIALYPLDGATRDGLLTAADAAMYVAKNNRKTRCCAADDTLASHRA